MHKQTTHSIRDHLAYATSIFAQNTTGKIVGTVSAADGAVTGATIVVTDDQTGKERTVNSNSDGPLKFHSFSFQTANGVLTCMKVDAAM